MDVRDATILEEEAINEFFIEIESFAESLHMTLRQQVIHQTELSIDDFGEQRNG